MGPFKDIAVEKTGHVALIEIRRPPNNFFDIALIQEIAGALEALDEDADCRAVVLAAQGKAFCAGANFGDGSTLNKEGQRPGELNREQAVQHLYLEGNRLFRTKKPIIAAVHGAAVGGGLGLAMVADFRVACPETRFCANFTRLGFHPGFGLTVTLPLVVGATKAAMMFYTSRRVRGDEAYAMGLADVLVPQDQVRAAAMKLAAEIAENSPLGLISTRTTMRGDLADRVLQGDRARAQGADLAAQDRRLQGRRQGHRRTPAAEFLRHADIARPHELAVLEFLPRGLWRQRGPGRMPQSAGSVRARCEFDSAVRVSRRGPWRRFDGRRYCGGPPGSRSMAGTTSCARCAPRGAVSRPSIADETRRPQGGDAFARASQSRGIGIRAHRANDARAMGRRRGLRLGRAAIPRNAVLANLQALLAAYGIGPERLAAALP